MRKLEYLAAEAVEQGATMLLTVGGLLLFWQIVRIIKFDYVIVTEPIGRYCWYSYYIPMVLVPLIGIMFGNVLGGITSFIAYKFELTSLEQVKSEIEKLNIEKEC